MFEWIADNKDLLIAIFGAGGAGTLVLVALLARSGASTEEEGSDQGSGAPAAPQGVNVTASAGGIAVGHVGTGDIDLRFNETVGEDAINDLQHV